VTYRTIRQDGETEIEIKKSRFICSLKRIQSEDEAKAFIQALKKEHWKANHHCSAYVLGENHEIQRSSDDGEPSGTAGVPILEVLKKNDLINMVAVVTRYFGGTKLGAGGLIRASLMNFFSQHPVCPKVPARVRIGGQMITDILKTGLMRG